MPRFRSIPFLALGAVAPFAATAQAPAPASNTGSFHLAATCARAMPLFTAPGERQWAKGWDPRMLSGSVQRGSVFRTRHGNGQPTTWVVTDYDPSAGRASYARLAEGSSMGLVDVRCTDGQAGARVQVTYTLTALSDAGRAFVAHFLAGPHYRAMLEAWRAAVSAALAK
jgi:hypothetical protein